jgi:MoaA/NifB/PqqE/SkfB family radical SAM enzyme
MRLSHALLSARVLLSMRRGRPLFLSFNVTNLCNQRCPMCAVPRSPVPELDPGRLEPIFRQFQKAGILVVELSGGEPFLRGDLFDLMALLDRLGLHCTMTTNGTVLPEGALAKLREANNLLQLGVSLDSLVPETYAALRGTDALATVLQTVDALAGAALPFPVKLNLTVNRLNYAEGQRLLEYAKARGLFLSAFPVNQGASLAHRRSDSLFETADGERAAMADLFRSFAVLRRRHEPLWEYSGFYRDCARYVLGEPLGPCAAGRLYLDLHADGALAACVDLTPFADLTRTSVAEALELLPGQAGAIAACHSLTPCCYTCTMNVGATARHPLAFAWESFRVQRAARRRPLP